MKVTAKLAMMGFNNRAFFEKLDDKLAGANVVGSSSARSGVLLLYKLFSKLAQHLNIYFSVNE